VRHGHAGEVAQLDEPHRLGVGPLETAEGFVERQEIVGLVLHGDLHRRKGNPPTATAVLVARLSAGALDQDAPHGPRGGPEEVAPAPPLP